MNSRSPIPRGAGSSAVQAAQQRNTPPPSALTPNGRNARPSTAGAYNSGAMQTPPPTNSAALNQMMAAAGGSPARPSSMYKPHPSHRPNTAGPVMGTSSPAAADRLSSVRANLAALSETVNTATVDSPHSTVKKKKGSHQIVLTEDRVVGIQNDTARIEQHLALEVKRRAESDKALQQMIEARAKEMTESIERKANEKLIKMHHLVDRLTKQVDVLDTELGKEREKNVRLTQELRFHATQGLDDVKKAVDQERIQRQEKEAMLSKKLSEDVFRLQERLDVERHARESMLTAIREEMVNIGNGREKTEEKFLGRIRQEVAQLKKQIFSEQETRERGEEHLAATMDEVVQQVQSGLRALAQA